jgi:hypothetical protein
VDSSWVTTQWLSEILFSLTHSAFGWGAFVAFRTLTAAVALAVLASTTIRGRTPALAAFPYLVAGAAVVSVSQERPQQITLIGAAALGGTLLAGMHGRLPRWWILLALTALWANFHGGWILAPAVLGLIAIGRVLDHGVRDATARRSLGLALGASVAGSISPAGPSGLWSVLRFSEATTVIQEWMPTTPMADLGYLTVAMVVIVGVAWSRPQGIPRSEALATLVLLIFAWSAWRYVAPALLLLAPLVAERLIKSFPAVGARLEPRWSAPAGILVAALMMSAGLVSTVGRDPLPYREYPVLLAQRIADLPRGQRVLNDYNVAGLVLAFGGTDTKVGIDGRADKFGAAYISDYTGAMSLEGEWRRLLTELDPSSALLASESALAQVLTTQEGWTEVSRAGKWVLLQSVGSER